MNSTLLVYMNLRIVMMILIVLWIHVTFKQEIAYMIQAIARPVLLILIAMITILAQQIPVYLLEISIYANTEPITPNLGVA